MIFYLKLAKKKKMYWPNLLLSKYPLKIINGTVRGPAISDGCATLSGAAVPTNWPILNEIWN